jgi:hypothetical protein
MPVPVCIKTLYSVCTFHRLSSHHNQHRCPSDKPIVCELLFVHKKSTKAKMKGTSRAVYSYDSLLISFLGDFSTSYNTSV